MVINLPCSPLSIYVAFPMLLDFFFPFGLSVLLFSPFGLLMEAITAPLLIVVKTRELIHVKLTIVGA